jgi:spermidine/putrescine transport system permease protein
MKAVKKIYSFLIYLFLYAPIILVIVFSFNNSKSKSVWKGFTLKWYEMLFRDTEILKSLYITLEIALLSAFIATVIGTLAAIGIYSYKTKRMKNLVMNITNIPMVSPEIVTGISLMFLFIIIGKIGIPYLSEMGFMTLLLAHITFNIPYVILSVLPKLNQMDAHLYEAALDLGCKPIPAFFKAVLPEIMPGILSSLVITFTLSLDDFVISYFTSGHVETLSIKIYSMTKKQIPPEVNALSAIMFVAVLLLLLIINLKQLRDESKQKQKQLVKEL